jgi:hypothetical protein
MLNDVMQLLTGPDVAARLDVRTDLTLPPKERAV